MALVATLETTPAKTDPEIKLQPKVPVIGRLKHTYETLKIQSEVPALETKIKGAREWIKAEVRKAHPDQTEDIYIPLEQKMNFKKVPEYGLSILELTKQLSTKKERLREIAELGDFTQPPPEISLAMMQSPEALKTTTTELQQNSNYFAELGTFNERKAHTCRYVGFFDAFYAYCDEQRLAGKTSISLQEMAKDPRFTELLEIFTAAGMAAYERFRNKKVGTPEYKAAMNDASIDAATAACKLLKKTSAELVTEINQLGSEEEIKKLVELYIHDPKALVKEKPNAGQLFLAFFRLANHTWKVGQVERKNQGEEDRVTRDVYRAFDALFYLEDAVPQLVKDIEHTKKGLVNLNTL